jgi:hypothetical protein
MKLYVAYTTKNIPTSMGISIKDVQEKLDIVREQYKLAGETKLAEEIHTLKLVKLLPIDNKDVLKTIVEKEFGTY